MRKVLGISGQHPRTSDDTSKGLSRYGGGVELGWMNVCSWKSCGVVVVSARFGPTRRVERPLLVAEVHATENSLFGESLLFTSSR